MGEMLWRGFLRGVNLVGGTCDGYLYGGEVRL